MEVYYLHFGEHISDVNEIRKRLNWSLEEVGRKQMNYIYYSVCNLDDVDNRLTKDYFLLQLLNQRCDPGRRGNYVSIKYDIKYELCWAPWVNDKDLPRYIRRCIKDLRDSGYKIASTKNKKFPGYKLLEKVDLL